MDLVLSEPAKNTWESLAQLIGYYLGLLVRTGSNCTASQGVGVWFGYKFSICVDAPPGWGWKLFLRSQNSPRKRAETGFCGQDWSFTFPLTRIHSPGLISSIVPS